LSITPRPLTPPFNNDGGSSDIEVSEIMDHCDLVKHAHNGQESHSDTPAHKRVPVSGPPINLLVDDPMSFNSCFQQ